MKDPSPTSDLAKALTRLAELGGSNLLERAERRELPRAYGVERYVGLLFGAIQERRSVLLLGPQGVGKSAVLWEAAHRFARGEAPAELGRQAIVQFTTTRIEAGAMNAGIWANNLRAVLDAVVQGKTILLYFDNIADLRDAGRYTGQSESFATVLKPYLQRRQLILLGEATAEQYTRTGSFDARGKNFALAEDRSLMDLFTIISLDEPDLTATRAILRQTTCDLEREYRVRVPAATIERALDVTRRFLRYQVFPGKAVRLLSQVARDQSAATAPVKGDGGPLVGADALMAGFAKLTGLPETMFSDAIPVRRQEVEAYFGERVIGQEEAVRSVVDLVLLIKAELTNPDRPLGVLFFVGPTGSGKTMLAKTLAGFLFGSEARLIRFDMSEYQHPDQLSGLTARLVEQVRQESFSVVLLDEIEKASPFVFHLFLQAFDDARLTDPLGRTVDLRNTIIVLTSNLGSELGKHRGVVGFAGPEGESSAHARLVAQVEESLKGHFRPEFLNRLDRIVVFRALDRADMWRIARREIGKALQREGLERRTILIDFGDDLLDLLLRRGFSDVYGARPLQRAVADLVLMPLAERLAAQPGLREQLLELRAVDDRLQIVPIPLPGPAIPAPPREEPAAAEGMETIADAGKGLRQVEQEIEAWHSRLAAHANSPAFGALQAASRRLLEESRTPSFWDDAERSRLVYATIYHLERVLERLTNARDRAEALAAIPALIRRHRDRRGVADLRAKLATLVPEATLAELEFLATRDDTVATGGAVLTISPLPARQTSDWPATLAAMYRAWALGRGFDVEPKDAGGTALLTIHGPSVAAILVGEGGVHQRERRDEAGGSTKRLLDLARVDVLPLTLTSLGEHAGQPPEHRSEAPASAGGEVVRVYELAVRHLVRDRRTGVTSHDARRVLAGDLDRFLLASLRAPARDPSGDGVLP